ncbi:type II and III secretion system protein family protein [Phenylobacterium sp. LjRoot219]|uniref:type II and III secretion system protein family protein n=1 Tax=Phenylobacterium sp. LjRoot219 TaxID=3342283 RepID=UPI003ECF3816
MPSNRRSTRPGPRKLLGALLATTAMFCAISADATAQPYAPEGAVRDVTADSSGYGGQVALPMGGSRILRFNRPIGRVMLGNPKVGDVIPLGERTLYVLGTAPGATNLTVMPRGGGEPLATLDLRVGYDVENIRRAARQVLPNEALDVSAHGDGLVLTGVLSSSAAAARAASLAEQFAPGHVVNLTSIRAAEQVMLSVRVAEVQRSALQQLGLSNLNALWDTTGALTFAAPTLNPDVVANLIGRDVSGDWTFEAVFDALERRGFASTLAEPNLVALSGETAVFFAGGEFPIPVPQVGAGTDTITIEYKQYGVSVGFTPTVSGDSINLAVAPEVSALDPANSVVLQGFRIPGLTTRRAKTTVELRNGQSFAIAGLIKRDFTDNLRGIPGAARLPVFGALFRSTGYQNNETEVIIIVTAHLAKPTHKENLIAPTDVRQGPSEADLFFMGATDKALPQARPQASATSRTPQAQPGAAGPADLASNPMASTPLTPPAAMLAVNQLVPATPAPAAPQPSPTAAAAPPMVRPTASAAAAPVSAPAPKPVAVTPIPAAKPAPAATVASAPRAAPAAYALAPAAKPAAPLAAAQLAVRPAAPPANVTRAAPTPRPAPSSHAVTPPARPAVAVAAAKPAARPAAAAVTARATLPAATLPAAPMPYVAIAAAKPAPAIALNASATGSAAPPSGAAQKPAAPTAKPVAADQVAAAQPASAAKLQVASTTLRGTLPFNSTPTSDAAAASAGGR